jgi:hypothetical protein
LERGALQPRLTLLAVSENGRHRLLKRFGNLLPDAPHTVFVLEKRHADPHCCYHRVIPVRQAQPTGFSNLSGISRASENAGAPEEIRTPDPQIRSLVLCDRVRAAVSAVKVWLRDFLVLAGGIQAKVPALHRAHQLLDGATMPPRHQNGGLRGDARDRAEPRTHHSPCGIKRGLGQNEDDGDPRGGAHKRDRASGRRSGRALGRELDAAQGG